MSGAELRAVMSVLSPRILSVIPLSHLAYARASIARLSPTEMHAQAAERSMPRGMNIVRVSSLSPRSLRLSTAEQGEHVLALYFWQVLGEGPVSLDLRARAFACEGDALLWSPSPLVANWAPDFRAACKDMYDGHFLGDGARFSAGARGLGLGHAEEELRAQFGDTRAVVFSRASFLARSTAVLRKSMAAGATIHPDFVTLSLMLAGMYDQLSRVRQPLNVRAAFERAYEVRWA